MTTLYSIRNACSMAQHIVLEWIGKPYEVVFVTDDMPAYKKINPSGVVPAMQVESMPLMTQNAALLKYLVHAYPEADLGSHEGAKNEYLLDRALAFVNSDLHNAFVPIFHTYRLSTDNSDTTLAGIKEAGVKNVDAQMQHLDQHLAENTYMIGDKKTVADAYVFTVIRWTAGLEKTWNDYPNIKRFHDMMMQDSAVAKVVAENNPQ